MPGPHLFDRPTLAPMVSPAVDYSALDAFERIELLQLPETHRLVDLSRTLCSYRILTVSDLIAKVSVTPTKR